MKNLNLLALLFLLGGFLMVSCGDDDTDDTQDLIVDGGRVLTVDDLEAVSSTQGDASLDFEVKSISAATSGEYSYIITDDSGNILGTPPSNMIEISGADAGVCRVYGISYTGTLTNTDIGGSIDDVASTGLSDLSANWITVTRNSPTITLNLSGLEDLGSDYMYEGWVMVPSAADPAVNVPVSTGIFSVDANGALSQTVFDISPENADAANTFVLTIEPTVDPDAAPSGTKYMGGAITNGMATASITHASSLGTAFTDVTGEYILAVPSDDTAMPAGTFYNGVWFLNNSSGSAVAGLGNLHTLPTGWRYEGWVVVNGTPISTGTFTTASGSDSDGAGATAGPNAGPPFPGQDFLSPLTDLRGGAVVVSIEPYPDNSTAPFTLKPLSGDIPAAPTMGDVHTLNNIAASTYPSGSISIQQ